jgi:hypothetical protein
MADDSSYTIGEFCAAERISRGMFYKLKDAGKAPRMFYVGNSPCGFSLPQTRRKTRHRPWRP